MKQNVVVFALIMLTLGSAASYSAPQVLADWLIDRSGTLIMQDSLVLGDEDINIEPVETTKPDSKNNETEKLGEQNKRQAEQKNEETKKRQEAVREDAKQKLERKIELNKQKNKNIENKFEISASKGELKVKQKTKLENGQEKETDLKLKQNETLHVDQEDGGSVDIDVKNPGELEIAKDKFKGRTRLPLSVNSSNELMVTRPDGTTKVVSVLPDEAVTKMIEHGVLVGSENVELTTNDSGDPVYQIKQEASKKVFGLFVVKFNSVSEVSATDSSVVTTESTETSPWRRFLERLSR